MLPAYLMARAIQLCAAASSGGVTSPPVPFTITVRSGATLVGDPATQADAEATIRDLVALGAEFSAGPLDIAGRDFATYGVTHASVFDACALARVESSTEPTVTGAASVSKVAALVRRAFGARVTDTIRPMTATYGARYSWHKYGQAIDFVPSGGVNSINRDQIRALMGQSGVRLIELLGPGDRGHSNHWHIAFAQLGQILDRTRPVEEEEDWIVSVASANAPAASPTPNASSALSSALTVAAEPPPSWDVFATAAWRSAQRGG